MKHAVPTPRKIVVLGPESTGKSTLSAALAGSLRTHWVPEYARHWLEGLDRPYTEPDLQAIARGQLASEDLLAARAPGLLVCDTDLYVIKVWSEHRFGRCDPWILEQIAARHYDLYLLTGIDMPWEPDPLREHPDDAMRQYFYNQYLDIVQHSGRPWACLSGPHEQRLQQALEAVRTLLPDV